MARFKPGDRVTVKSLFPPTPPTHIRTPYYIRGKSGEIERICGAFGNPEELAFNRRDGEKQVLYRVRFNQDHVWPDYAGPKTDTVEIEIFEHWLEPAGEGEKAA